MQWLASADTNLPKITITRTAVKFFCEIKFKSAGFFEGQAFSAFTNEWKSSWFNKKMLTAWNKSYINILKNNNNNHRKNNITGLYILLDFFPAWADPGSCSPGAYVKIFQPCFKLSGWPFPSFYMFHVFSIFSQISPCSPIRDGRMGQLVEPSSIIDWVHSDNRPNGASKILEEGRVICSWNRPLK